VYTIVIAGLKACVIFEVITAVTGFTLCSSVDKCRCFGKMLPPFSVLNYTGSYLPLIRAIFVPFLPTSPGYFLCTPLLLGFEDPPSL
jgi:hypothetical protein